MYERVLLLIDGQIQRLTEVRKLLSGSGNSVIPSVLNGRKTRHMSAEAGRRISEAQKRRWATQKKAGKKK